MSRFAILGGGSWGTALAILLSRARESHQISIWVHDAALAGAMRGKRENEKYLPGQVIPADVSVFSDLHEALRGAEIIVGAMPAAHAREIYLAAVPYLTNGVIIVSATKGLEPATHARMSEMIAQTIARPVAATVSVVRGPSFAMEAARGEPTA